MISQGFSLHLSADKYRYFPLSSENRYGLENRLGASPREFESLTLRQVSKNPAFATVYSLLKTRLHVFSENKKITRLTLQETVAHGQSVEKIRTACEDIGIPFVMMASPIRASEDFGYYTKQIPGAMFIVGAGDVPEIHTHEYDFDDDLIEIVASIYLKLASY